MAALDVIGVVLLAGCLVLLGFLARRYMLVRRGGTVEMSWRLRHWTFGIGRWLGAGQLATDATRRRSLVAGPGRGRARGPLAAVR